MAYHIAVTGHRPPKVGGYKYSHTQQWVRSRLSAHLNLRLQHYGNDLRVYSGFALGVDQWWAQEAFALGIRVIAVIPFPSQPNTWPAAAQNFYQQLLGQCYDVVQVNPDPYAAWKLHARNHWMVDHCDELVSVWNGIPEGGTWKCVEYADQLGRQRYNYWPSPAHFANWAAHDANPDAADEDAPILDEPAPPIDFLAPPTPANLPYPTIVVQGPPGNVGLPPGLQPNIQQLLAAAGSLTDPLTGPANVLQLQGDLNSLLAAHWPDWHATVQTNQPVAAAVQNVAEAQVPNFMDQPPADPEEANLLNPPDDPDDPF